jgi:hypothetical protein
MNIDNKLAMLAIVVVVVSAAAAAIVLVVPSNIQTASAATPAAEHSSGPQLSQHATSKACQTANNPNCTTDEEGVVTGGLALFAPAAFA